MAFIRDRKEELTGYQESAAYNDNIDLQCDFVMVYGIDKTMPDRVKQYKDKGYVVHLMTGSAWGEYQDYLYGKWDGINHWDESQMDREGNHILHGKDVPYMVPSISFSEYLTENLKAAVDAGVEAIHLEEPEFWDYGGYSDGFKREYHLYYREEWKSPHLDLDARYKCSKLKAYLYARTLERISGALKEYAMTRYNRYLPVYIPTHSLLNYTQWKIMSPEGALTDIPSLDGYIAQVWTGTSRTANMFEGVLKERTFETAYLEYGIMQELVKSTDRKMWFLHDPIEDNPAYTWENYRYNYLKTVTASLLHPDIHTYEVCPWPNRVFNGQYPKGNKGKHIPSDYRNLLSGLIQTLGNMDQEDVVFEGHSSVMGILMSDSGLFQRTFPDKLVTENPSLSFIESEGFPQFYGMAMPLLKYGLPVRPVQLDHVRRFPGYLEGYRHLILSYEYIKPESPDINNGLSAWVRSGGTLIYIGNNSDPYHLIKSWWNTGNGNYDNPAQHLFEMLGISAGPNEGGYTVGKGRVIVINEQPSDFCLSYENADKYRKKIKEILKEDNIVWEYSNYLTLRRGPYIISAVMDESHSDEAYTFKGTFADLYTSDFKILSNKTLMPDENILLYDFSKIEGVTEEIIATSAKIFKINWNPTVEITVKAAADVHVNIRLRLPKPLKAVTATDEDGNAVEVSFKWDDDSQSILISYNSQAKKVDIKGVYV